LIPLLTDVAAGGPVGHERLGELTPEQAKRYMKVLKGRLERVRKEAQKIETRYRASAEEEYEDSVHRDGRVMRPHGSYEPGQLVLVATKNSGGHWYNPASGPYLILED
jgi:lysine/ornithine N-monooxygenase